VFVGLGLAAWVTRLPQPRETVVTPSEEELQLAAL
jgi:hypothetical protein